MKFMLTIANETAESIIKTTASFSSTSAFFSYLQAEFNLVLSDNVSDQSPSVIELAVENHDVSKKIPTSKEQKKTTAGEKRKRGSVQKKQQKITMEKGKEIKLLKNKKGKELEPICTYENPTMGGDFSEDLLRHNAKLKRMAFNYQEWVKKEQSKAKTAEKKLNPLDALQDMIDSPEVVRKIKEDRKRIIDLARSYTVKIAADPRCLEEDYHAAMNKNMLITIGRYEASLSNLTDEELARYRKSLEKLAEKLGVDLGG